MLLKKLSLGAIACFLAFFLAFAAPSPAQDNSIEDSDENDLNQEGPLTQKDIDLYLEFVALYDELVEKSEADPDYDQDEEIMAFIQNNGLTFNRFRYIVEKVPFGVMVLTAPEPQLVPPLTDPYLELSNEEKKLLSANLNKLSPTFESD
ncbi:MAG: hypothetical protein LBS60_11060 [Deltaproteobacteria bacterium]|jgi:hypothetical protein|nr:hypothetical protein [Deltaproteobacteria bacterium]